MNCAMSKSVSNGLDQLYRKNKRKSIRFLFVLSAVLLLTVLLSLRAGSYETPIGELVKGIFGLSSDRKINLVVRNNRLPRILTSILAGGAIPWPRHPPWAYPRVPPLVLPLPSLCWGWALPLVLELSCVPSLALLRWRW